MKRVLSLVFGLSLLGVVVFLGFKVSSNPSFVIWFGLSAAILAPIGMKAISYTFSIGDREIFKQLSKVPETKTLIREAKSQEEKVRLLEGERTRIEEVVQFESCRQALLERKESLEKDGVRILDELRDVDLELEALNINIESTPAAQQVKLLHERLQARRKGDLIIRIGTSQYRLDRDLVFALPFDMGRLLLAYFRMVEGLLRRNRRN